MKEHQMDHWRRILAGLEPIELPTDRRPGAGSRGPGSAGARRGLETAAFELSQDVADRFAQLADGWDVPVSTLPVAVFLLLLARYSGSEDVAVRVGDVVLRADLSGDPTFAQIVERVQHAATAAAQAGGVPFETLAEELRDVADLDRLLAFDPQGSASYGTELYDAASIGRLMRSFTGLADAVAAAPGGRGSEFELLVGGERREVLVEWNDTAVAFPETVPVHRLVEERVAAQPGVVAVRSADGGEVTYGELNARANQLAHYLGSIGVGPGAMVAVCLDRSAELLVTMLGAVKAGSAYVPMDPGHPAERLAFMAEDCGASVVVTDTAHAELFPSGTVLLLVDGEAQKLAGQPDDDLDVAVDTSELCYVIYTSGSTGRPKGVAIEHRGVVNLMQWTTRSFGLGPHARVALCAGVGFDAFVWEVWPALAAGATCCVPSEEVRVSPAALRDWLGEQGVRGTFLSTPMVEAFAALAWEEVSSLEYVLTGGDLLRLPVDRPLPFQVVNNYGPTEATVLVTSGSVVPGEAVPSIGSPIDNCQVFVVDSHDRPVPVGVVGQLLIGGCGLARGYVNSPELTADRFVGFDVDGSSRRVYRTGDLVRWRADGQLEFVGRVDSQVKVRGFRIELGEIEAALLTDASVAAAVVIVREDTPGDKRLVACVVAADPSAGLVVADVRAGLEQVLPRYMVPAGFIVLDAFPLTGNGKIDRRALMQLDYTSEAGEAGFVAPRTETERAVVEVWSEVLGVARIGVHDNFFHLGGHSLLATQLASRLRTRLGVDIPVGLVFAEPTPAGIAQAIDGLDRAAARSDDALLPVPRDGSPLPLSFAQQRLWLLDQLEPGSTEYVVPLALRITGPVDLPALRAAFAGIVARHEVLRTRFAAAADGRPVQIVDAPGPFDLTVHDLRGTTDAAAREQALDELVETGSRRPIDLAAGPMLRADLVRLAERDTVLLITVHHIAFDGWSVGVLSRELTALYSAELTGSPSALPALAAQYADFSVWQRERLSGDVLDAQLDYWRRHLDGIEPLELPTDHRRAAHDSASSGTVDVAVPAEVVAKLGEIAAGNGASLFMVLLAVFQLLLSKYSRQDDIAVGTPIAGRNRAEIEDLVGFFVNTLVMRTDLSQDSTFVELLGRVTQTALGAYDHQDLPFERLVEELAPDRDLSRNPLFQTMFALQNVPDLDSWRLADATVSVVDVPEQNTKFDLTLTLVQQADGGLRGTVDYRADLFERDTVERLAGHFDGLAGSVAAGAGGRLSEFELLVGRERREVLVEWNDTAVAFPQAVPVHRLVEERVAAQPGVVAVRSADGSEVTYGELNARANQLAHYLGSVGVGSGSMVAVCLDRGAELLVTLLAAVKAGAAYVPMDPGYPAERLAFMAEDCGASVVVTDTAHAELFPAGVELFLVDEDWSCVAQRPDADVVRSVGASDLCYVIYTSGSTGRPKGVAIEHRGVVNLMQWTARSFGLGSGARVALTAGVGFDAFALEVWPTLAAGATCCVPSEEVRVSAPALRDWLLEQGIRGTYLSTPMVEAFAALSWDDYSSLEYVLTGGDLLRLPVDRPLPFRVVNNYGPTEATVLVTSGTVLPGEAVPSIGGPIDNCQVFVVDAYDRPVPVGVVGELLIGGCGLARGYVNRPELTAERFVGFDVDGSSRRVYRTGDLVRWRADGQLEFVGRVDSQVKVRGFRIELGEIEAALLTDASVGGAVVIVREDSPGDKRLVACIVSADPSAELAVADVRAGLEQVLPRYMIPAGFIVLDAFPLTGNGKIDRRSLMQLDYTSEVRETGFVAPRTETERAVVEVWSEVLGVARIGVHDNFFHLGGHSLLATQLASRLRTRLGVDVPVRTIFTKPTPAGLADAIGEIGIDAFGDGAAAASSLLPAERDGRPLPLSFAQQRLWFLDRLEPGNTEYLIPVVLHVKGLLDLPALEAALSGILARHEALRTRFVPGADDQPVQIVDAAGPLTMTVHDLRDIGGSGNTNGSEEDRDAAARRLIEADRTEPFDLAGGPLLRVSVVRLADTEQYVLLTVHHIVFDGWSEAIFARELDALYAAALEDDIPAALPVPPVQYPDFAVWQRDHLTGDLLDAQLDYWRGQLTGIEPLELPTDHKRSASRGGPAGTLTFAVPADVAERARAAATRQEASLFMVLLAVFQLLLSKYSRQDDIAVGTPIAGRNRAEIEDLVGFFVNTLVMRTDLSQDPTFAELLDRVRQAALGAYDHQDLPFERLVEELAPDRELSRNPLFQTMFVLQNVVESGAWNLSGLDVESQPVTLREAKFDLTLVFSEQEDGGLLGSVEYRADLFEEASIGRLADHFGLLLGTVLDRPDARLSEVDLLAGRERHQVLVEWNDTAVVYPEAAPVHRLVEQRVAAQPDVVAIRSADGAEVTYAELNARANQLAHYLGSVGVGPGSLVAVCLDRSAELLVTILGAVKAGAAYAPMDPGYPADRLAFMAQDCGAPVVVTDTAHAAFFPAGTPLLLVDRDWAKVTGQPVTDPDVAVDISECCYVIYTSGSTGRPKGAQVEHRGLANLVLWAQRMLGLDPGDRMALSAAVAFDAFAWEVWLCLSSGATCHLPTESVRLSPTALRDWLVRQRIRGTFLSTPMLEAVAALPWDAPTPVEFILTGGDLLRLPAGRELPFGVHNVYGPTETTVMVSSTWIEPGDPVPPIGRPTANCELFVVDPHGRPVPIGVPGELLISGYCVGRGYLNRPELTAERFVGFDLDGRGRRVYRTGDLVKWRADGVLEFVGRIDGQVKLRGYRVELGEIEATLLAHPGVAAASVIVREDTPGDKRLAAYVVPADPADPVRVADLRESLARSLPEYMVPTAFVLLDVLPLTNNGKIDRRALPVSDLQARDPRDAYTAARSPIEKAITKIWAEVLGVERVSVHDNFFHLGGHSLLATQVVSRLGRLVDMDVPVRTLFTSPTPAQLAVAVGELVKSAIAARFGRTDQVKAGV